MRQAEESVLRRRRRVMNLDGCDAELLGGLQVDSEVVKEDGFTGFHVQRSQRVFVDTSLRLTHPHLARLYHLDTHGTRLYHLDTRHTTLRP